MMYFIPPQGRRTLGERKALAHMFARAIGSYKNPHSHRTVNLTDPREAQEMVMHAFPFAADCGSPGGQEKRQALIVERVCHGQNVLGEFDQGQERIIDRQIARIARA